MVSGRIEAWRDSMTTPHGFAWVQPPTVTERAQAHLAAERLRGLFFWFGADGDRA